MEGDLGAYIKFVSPPRVNLLSELQYMHSSPAHLYGSYQKQDHDSEFCQPADVEQTVSYLDQVCIKLHERQRCYC